jgi:hypothetical protein
MKLRYFFLFCFVIICALLINNYYYEKRLSILEHQGEEQTEMKKDLLLYRLELADVKLRQINGERWLQELYTEVYPKKFVYNGRNPK